jgi:Uma2 family endonuclease
MSAVLQPAMTLQAYLAWENAQTERHEFHRGEAYLMVGARRSHGRVVSNLNGLFFNALRGNRCQVFAESMKVLVADDTVLYPDLFVTCDRADLATEQLFRAPTLVLEVLSPSTAGYDRGEKFALYRRLPALREYLLVDPLTRRVEGFRLRDDGTWTFHDMSEGPALDVASLGILLPLAQVFDGVDPLEDAPAGTPSEASGRA